MVLMQIRETKLILHLTPDDKFVPFLQGLFEEALPGKNMWRVNTEESKAVFAQQNTNTENITNKYFRSKKFENDLAVANCVIFHSLWLSYPNKLEVLWRLPKNMPIVWRGWGYDYYNYLEANGLKLYLSGTKALQKKLAPCAYPTPKQLIKKILLATVGKIINQQFISRVDYFSCCVPNDYVELKRVLPNFTAKSLPLNYYSKEDVFLRGNDLQDLSGKDILLGNSATATNNHVEAIHMLSELGMRGRKVIVPLSYGDLEYQTEIIRVGERLLGESFVPITKYMTLAEYNQIISSCGNLMMNHIRQQAMGNISAALLRGGKVFLRPENPTYKYFTEMGATIFRISDDLKIENFDEKINIEIANRNKDVMELLWARDQGIKHAKNIFQLGSPQPRIEQ